MIMDIEKLLSFPKLNLYHLENKQQTFAVLVLDFLSVLIHLLILSFFFFTVTGLLPLSFVK